MTATRETAGGPDLPQALAAHDAAMTRGEWFADFGKIGVGDEGIGEVDWPSDAAGIAYLRNALPAIIASGHELERLRGGVERLRKALTLVQEAGHATSQMGGPHDRMGTANCTARGCRLARAALARSAE